MNWEHDEDPIARAVADVAAVSPVNPSPVGEQSPPKVPGDVALWRERFGRGLQFDPLKPPPARKSLLRWRRGDEWFDGGPWLGTAGILAGEGAAGKSWAALDLALKVAGGVGDSGALPFWCGARVVEAGRVVYVAAEDPEDELNKRLAVLWQCLTPIQREWAAERLTIVPLASESPELLRVWRVSRSLTDAEAAEAGAADARVSETIVKPGALVEAMRESFRGDPLTRPKLVILDPLARLGGSDAETDNGVAARLMRELGALAADAGAAVLVVHHTTKSARKEGEPVDGTGIRGASALSDGARWCAVLTLPKGGGVLLTVTKASYGDKADPVMLARGKGGVLAVETPEQRAAREDRALDAEVAKEQAKAERERRFKERLSASTASAKPAALAAVQATLGMLEK